MPAEGISLPGSSISETPSVMPVVPGERISSIDTLRGFAVLGILLMNVASFALPTNAYDDPTIAGGAKGINLAVWAVNYILFEGKMRALFSMLFGAGVVLLTSRAEQRGGEGRIADIYYRRTLWLLAFGLAHAYFLWEGDILYFYAVVGLMLFPFRKLPAKRLLLLAGVLLAVLASKGLNEGLHVRSLHDKAAAADQAAAAGKTLTEDQKNDQRSWADRLKEIKPPAPDIEKEIAAHRGGYWKLFLYRQEKVAEIESVGFYRFGFFDAASMMLIGMALVRLRVFSAAR